MASTARMSTPASDRTDATDMASLQCVVPVLSQAVSSYHTQCSYRPTSSFHDLLHCPPHVVIVQEPKVSRDSFSFSVQHSII